MSRKSKQLSWRKRGLRAAPVRRLHFEPLESRQLLTAAPLLLPTPNFSPLPPLQPTVITAGGQRLLLNYFNNAYNAAHNPSAEVQVSFDSTADQLVCNKPGWWVENFPLTQINGLQGETANQIAALLFGAGETAADVQNWYVMTPVDATHPAPAEPPAPTGPAPITPTNLTAQAADGSYYHVLVVDSSYNGRATSDPSYCDNSYKPGDANTIGACLTDVQSLTGGKVVVDSSASMRRSLPPSTRFRRAPMTTASRTRSPGRRSSLIAPGSGSYEQLVNLSGTGENQWPMYDVNGTSTHPLIFEGVADANGNLPVWGYNTPLPDGWTPAAGTTDVYKSSLSANTWLQGNVVEHTNSDVSGDLTPGTGNQQTLVQASLPSALQEGQATYQFSSDEFENNLYGMSSQSACAQLPDEGLPADANWTTVNTTSVNGDPGYLDFGSTGAGAAASSVYWASTWVWVPPADGNFNWQDPVTLTEPTGNFTYGPFRMSWNPSEDIGNQYNKDRIWVNGQLVPAAIFSTGTDNTSLDPHSFPWYGDNLASLGMPRPRTRSRN